jgi:hypothetical protein
VGGRILPKNHSLQVEIENEYYQGTIQSVPLKPNIPNYQVVFAGSPDSMEVPISQLFALNEPVSPLIPEDTADDSSDSFPSLPEWIQENTHITLFQDGSHRCGIISSTNSG